MDIIAWLILRIIFAWMFLYPLTMLLNDWEAAKANVGMISSRFHHELAFIMVIVMVVGALSILLGILPHIGGLMLLVYCLLGALVHYRFADSINQLQLSSQADEQDLEIFDKARTIGAVGHITSAQKNFVLAALACWFMLMGTGPWSIVSLF